MSFFSSLAGQRIVSGTLAIPLYGLWVGDVMLASDDPIPDAVPVVIGNLTLHGYVYRSAPFGSNRRCLVIAGYGGLRKVVTPKQYALAGGVRLGMVLRDMAMEVGERVNVPKALDRVIGTGYAREGAAASRVLRQLAGENWYVDPAGVIQIQAWPTRKVSSPFTVIDQDGAPGIVTIASEDYAAWMPNCTFAAPTLAGTLTSGGTLFRFGGDGEFRMEVMTQ